MSLLQDVLRSHTTDTLEKHISNISLNPDRDDSDDELVNVVSVPGTPARSRPPSRPQSPTRRAVGRPAPGPLHLGGSRKPSNDPLKAFPTELSQKVFSRLSIGDLAKCAQVSRKWSKSQTLNYVWFQLYRKENFHDESLPPGKWTKRESKQNWRTMYLQTIPTREPTVGPLNPTSRGSGYSSPSRGSGYQTPKEVNEEKWHAEAQLSKPGKVEMRDMYKEMGGRKSKGKTKLGMAGGARDKGGWADDE